MENTYKVDIVSPEKVVFSDENIEEVILPSYEGEMGILKDHISIISFLKPGIIKINSEKTEEKYYIEDGIVEFNNNNLSILTSFIFNVKDMDKSKIEEIIKKAENELKSDKIDDQKKYLIDQKIDTLKFIN